ncbi:surface antigen BspA-like [Trichomonas vaginalis G3]|uniref:Surface antigen BspA-like n=1 Tax=Trichomonas vaginalis (strain ATCC PRA-98 / G3) TaxID=412133 RepID=A2G162_TRIV3|nr:ribonuclease inhibitor domain-containing protein [Trichomonas vaginalis G3]EAX89100.1 surface antigen BspA-like [Trichomonas vaginalis G3]KAI5505988.1 ribonuclease inhibitor domain-containing protein [Trichomonas vaginalis G3]|eukprot:XP_001302030.1 surface antigen BspA-like [Trichomonas vaginalis G3]
MSISSFESCSKLNNIIFETSSVTILRSRSFYSCQSLSSIKLPSTIVSIESECFAYCNQLSIVSFPQTLQTISNNAFINCNIVSADLSKCTKINILNDYVFHSNIDLSDFKFPPNINTIGVHSLSKTSISRINLPSRVQTINNYAFEECSNLDTIIIPEDSNLEFLGIGVFRYCFSISTINCTCPRYSIFGGALFNSDKTSLILFPPASRYSFFSLPDTTTTISQSAFQSCRNLVSVFIPSFSVRTISSNAFEGCTSLKSINIPLCVERVEQDAFLGCSSLECGLHIENRNKDFIHKLVNVSGLPSISIKQCISLYSCKDKLDKFSINMISPFIVIYIS